MQTLADIKTFKGEMDLDSPNESIQSGSHAMGRNGRFQGRDGNEQWQVIDGNRLIPGQNFYPAGNGKTIGRYYDAKNNRIFIWRYNSNNNHGIYIYNTRTATFQTLLEIGVTTDGDILGFTPDNIHSINIIYGDPVDGSLLCFVDTLGRPTKLNIDRFLGLIPGKYAFVKRAYIEVIKAPPHIPPRCVYENDPTVQANNLNGSLFRARQSYGYDDHEQSVASPVSIIPLPSTPFSNTTNIDKSIDARIAIYLRTGDFNVKKIFVYIKQFQNGSESDWQLADILDKASLNIPDNGIYKYLFYNDGNLTPVDPAYNIQVQDFVPQKAKTQELPNGNTLVYGGITEGYDYVNGIFSDNLIGTAWPDRKNYLINGVLFFGDYNGTFTTTQPNIELFLTGEGTNDANGNPTSLSATAQATAVNIQIFARSNGVPIGFSANIGSNITSIPAALALIATAATGAGWSVIQTKTNSIVISYPTGSVIFENSNITALYSAVSGGYQLAMYPQDGRSYGIVYFDKYGRTNGVITDITANLSTLPYSPVGGVYTTIIANLNGINPPSWAFSYQIVRTNSLTYDKHLYWVSNEANSNAQMLVTNKYAYIGITNIQDYNNQINASQGVVSYGFAQGDRIRFIGRFDVNQTFFQLGFDYTILGVVIDPLINGTPHVGTFVQIAYPDADISANFKFDGSADFQNYFILLYSVDKASAQATEQATESQVYYEFGHQGFIGNAGTPNAYHMGNTGTNQYTFSDGEIFLRTRTVPAGNTYYIDVSRFDFGNRYATPLIQLPSNITTTQYIIGPQNNLPANISDPTQYPRFSDGGGLLVNSPSTSQRQFRLRGTVPVTSDHPAFLDIYVKIDNSGGGGSTITLLHKSDPIGEYTNQPFVNVTFDATFGLPAGAKAWLIFGNSSAQINMHCGAFQMRVDVLNNIPITIFEPSFSDVYSIKVNSTTAARSFVQDKQAKQIFYPNTYRWGQAYIADTNINNSNRFYFQDADETVRSYGDIRRFIIIGKIMYILHYSKIGIVGIFQKFIINNKGESQLIVNDKIFEPNNTQYDIYEGGCGNQEASACVSDYAIYFSNPVKGHICRRSLDGVTIISRLYRVQTWAGGHLTPYLDNYAYQFGGNASVLGTFRVYPDKAGEYFLMAQSGTNGPLSIPGECLAFDESKNMFTSFYDFDADQILCAENQMFTWKAGMMYIHDDKVNTATFFGSKKECFITLVFNKDSVIKKTFNGVSYHSNQLWRSKTLSALLSGVENVDAIITSETNPQTGFVQSSNLIEKDYDIFEGVPFAALRRDCNSGLDPVKACFNGDFLKGTWIQIKFGFSGTGFSYLQFPSVRYSISQRNF